MNSPKSMSKPNAIDIILRLNRYFNALDARDWGYCLNCFEEIFDADYTVEYFRHFTTSPTRAFISISVYHALCLIESTEHGWR